MFEVLNTPALIRSGESSTNFQLKNTGKSTFSWDVFSDLQFISISPFSGKLSPGQVVDITALIKNDEIEEDVYYTNLTFRVNFSQYYNSGIGVINYTEKKWLLDEAVIDAAYDKKTDRIYAVTDSKKLLFIDPILKTTEAYPLIHKPTCISLHPDGNLLLIGNESSISHFDISQKNIIKETENLAPVTSIVFGESNWAHVLTSYHAVFFSLNLLTNERITATGDFELYNNGSLVKHPTEPLVYYFFNLSEKTPIRIFNISQGPGQYEGELISNSGNPIPGKIWFSDDGQRLYNLEGNIFEKDLPNPTSYKHVGTLNPYYRFFSLIKQNSISEDIIGIQNYAGIFQLSDSKFLKYKPNFERFEEKTFPKFLFDENDYFHAVDSEVLTSFFSNDGQYLHFICSPVFNGEKLKNSAVYTVKVR
ncbi:hypothetical protein MM239_08795 [Belliella sp. DSM 111904]|uniref:Uncharacterized protein n=1 Tax=Belliella filtrata TaxID=2923435 RepID=A0ABS9UZA1_9BACT|nr:hypothetical protein [Belliella filtrata]MCH7409490.1 hypothetical protein [Belliella filtrata]